MTAPAPLTVPVAANTPSATSLQASGLGAVSADRITSIVVIGDKSGSLAVATAGWTLNPADIIVGSGMTLAMAYKAAATDDAVQFTWTGAASAAMHAHRSPGTDFATSPPVKNTNAANTGANNSHPMPDAAWTPVDTDVRLYLCGAKDDGRKPYDTWPDPDNNVTTTAGAAGDAEHGLCTGGYTASSPITGIGSFGHANPNTNYLTQLWVLKEVVAAGLALPIRPRSIAAHL